MTSRIQQRLRINKCLLDTYYNWRITHDVRVNTFEPFFYKIMKSDQSWFIDGPTVQVVLVKIFFGKTLLVKLIKQTFNDFYITEILNMLHLL